MSCLHVFPTIHYTTLKREIRPGHGNTGLFSSVSLCRKLLVILKQGLTHIHVCPNVITSSPWQLGILWELCEVRTRYFNVCYYYNQDVTHIRTGARLILLSTNHIEPFISRCN